MTAPASSAPGPSSGAGPNVIYVMGAGRSGSTILGVALGNCEGVFYAGELDKWLMRSGIPALGGDERERFWERVRARVEASELFGFRARALERSSTLLRPRKWRERLRLGARYREVAEQLYRAIAEVSGATHIVDSSHYPLRARELQSLEGIDLHLIFLVRDPRAVVASFARADVPERTFGTFTTNAYLWLTHLVSLFVFLRHPRRRRVLLRYEDFLADPDSAMRDVLDRVGSAAATPDFTSLRTGLPIQGNRLIREPVVELKSPEATSPARSPLTSLLQLPWRLVFRLIGPRAGREKRTGGLR
jgi:hypothetical protein